MEGSAALGNILGMLGLLGPVEPGEVSATHYWPMPLVRLDVFTSLGILIPAIVFTVIKRKQQHFNTFMGPFFQKFCFLAPFPFFSQSPTHSHSITPNFSTYFLSSFGKWLNMQKLKFKGYKFLQVTHCNLRNLWQQRHVLSNMVIVKVSFETLYYFTTFSNVFVEWKKQSNI